MTVFKYSYFCIRLLNGSRISLLALFPSRPLYVNFAALLRLITKTTFFFQLPIICGQSLFLGRTLTKTNSRGKPTPSYQINFKACWSLRLCVARFLFMRNDGVIESQFYQLRSQEGRNLGIIWILSWWMVKKFMAVYDKVLKCSGKDQTKR